MAHEARAITMQEIASTAGALVLALVWTLALAHQQEKHNVARPCKEPLFDRLHARLSPAQPRWRPVVHAMPLLLLLVAVCRLPWLLTANLLTIYALLLILRGLTFSVTRMPPPRTYCEAYKIQSFFLGGCSDMMYSGHTTLLTLCALFLCTYSNPSSLLVVFVIVFLCVSLTLLVLTRHHYSSDILVAVFLSVFAFLALRLRQPAEHVPTGVVLQPWS